MLDESYNIKIIDFGDARKVDEEAEPEEEEIKQDDIPQNAPSLLRRDTFVGTVNYQSPEVINGEE
jgi:3-phosphoinositide dependent protein kinase-1